MTEAEFRSWQQFYRESPFDDLHRFHRPMAMLTHGMPFGDYETRLSWLVGGADQSGQAQVAGHQFSEADLRTFEALGMKFSGS